MVKKVVREIPEVVGKEDIHVYQVLTGEFRAYVKTRPDIEVWSFSKRLSLLALTEKLAALEIPFSF